MAYHRKLAVFARIPEPGRVKTRLVPPLTEHGACELYTAFVADLFRRLGRLKKVDTTVFYAGGADPSALARLAPARFAFAAQQGETLGDRLTSAFAQLLGRPGSIAVAIGSDSPDVPLSYIKQAFLKLKHRDVVLGPASDGGYYLVGLNRELPELFAGPEWSTEGVLERTLETIETRSLRGSLLPLWYDVDDAASLALLRVMIAGRRIDRRDRLRDTERVLDALFSRAHT